MIHIFTHLVAPIVGNSIRQSIATPVQNVNLHPIAGMELFHPRPYSVGKCFFWGDPTSAKEAGKIYTTWETWPPGIIFYKAKHHQNKKFNRASLTTVHTMLRCQCTDVPLHLECLWPQGNLTTCVKSIFWRGLPVVMNIHSVGMKSPESKNMVETRLDI